MQFLKKGFSLVEIIVVLAIIILISFLILGVFGPFNRAEALDRSVDKIISSLNEARQLTLFSSNDSSYGLHLESKKVIIFKGESYTEGNSENITFPLDKSVEITEYTLNGGGSEIVFNRLTGETNQYGSITVSQDGGGDSAEIIISQSGLAEIQ